jgi:hypothetical protein
MPPCLLVPAALSAGDEPMLTATAKTDSAQCIKATSISHSRQTTFLISKRKNRAIAQINARSNENARWISGVSKLHRMQRATI